MELEPLVLPVEADDAVYQQKMAAVERRLDKFAKMAMSIGTKMSLGITAPLTFFAKTAVSAYSDFDQAMVNSTSIMSGMTEANRKAMEDQAKAIAGSTRTSAAKAAEAYYFLASAGMDATTAIAALPIVEKFATAGAFDMAKATELLADSQSALGLSSGTTAQRMIEMTRVSDVLVDAANMSNASVEQFAKSLTTKSAAALRGMNKEVEEGVAVLAVYADAGIKGEMAGEKLAIMLRETQNAAMKEAKAWDSLGISIYDSNGKMKNLADVVQVLEGATAGMSDQQKVARFSMLGLRSESIDAIRPLMGMTDKIRDYEKRLRGAGGATDDVSKKQMKSFSAQMDILTNQMQLASIEIGEALAPSVMRLNTVIADGLTYWRSLSQETKQFTVNMGKVIAIMGPAMVIAAQFTSTMSTLSPVLSQVYTAAKVLGSGVVSMISTFALANPITATILAIGLAIAGVTALILGPEGMATAWTKAKTYVMDFTASAIGFLKNFSANVGILYTWLTSNWRTILTDMLNAYIIYNQNMISNIGVVLKTSMRLFVAFYGWLYQTSTTFWKYIFSDEFANAVRNGAVAAFEAIVDFSMKSWAAIVAFQTAVTSIFQAIGTAIVDTLSAIPMIVWDVLAKTGAAFNKVMRDILTGNLPDISAFMKEIAANAQEAFLKAADGAVKGIAAASLIIEDKMKAVTDQVAADFNKGMSDPNFFNTAKDILAEGMADMVSPLEGFQAQTLAPQFITGAKEMAIEGMAAGNEIAEAGAAAATGLEKATTAADDLQKKMGKKMQLELGKPVDAVGAYTTDALALWVDYQKKAKDISNSAMLDAHNAKNGPGPGEAGPVVEPPVPGLGPDVMNDPRFANLAKAKASGTFQPPVPAVLAVVSTGAQASDVTSSSVGDAFNHRVEALLTKIEQNTRMGGITIKQISGN